jgi:hypothetical protein
MLDQLVELLTLLDAPSDEEIAEIARQMKADR